MSRPLTPDDSIFFNYGDAKYTAWPTSFTDVLPEAKKDGPVAILPTKEVLDADWLKDFFDSSKDDVLRQEFAKGILLQPNVTAASFSSGAKALLNSWGNSWIQTLAVTVPPGPYFYKDNALWQVLRLFDDHQGAFLVSLRPAEDGAYTLLNDGSHGWSCCSIAVPSRLTVKDSPETTGGSGSGSATAVAAYEWVAIGIGTDTNGSIRRPAQCNGVFGLRPSQGVFPQDGMFTVFKTFDVPGNFARDLDKLASFATKWYGDRLPKKSTKHLLSRIVLPIDLLPEDDTPQQRVFLDFLKDFETHMGITADRISVSALWAENPPKEADGQGMHDAAAFRDKYLQLHGRQPFVSKFVQWRWNVGSKVSKEEHEEAMQRMKAYEDWVLDTVLQMGKRNTFVVMQSEDVTPKYRDDPLPLVSPKSYPTSWRNADNSMQ
ncbi:MAG: hypothetical protein L6R37_007510 [Teloschistes peruensis]|nr:MAG: hypothetical protein L6R37_007510 [Teloschistes peruensis]